MQSAAANAGAGEDSTAAPTVTAPMMEAKESRRDWPAAIEFSWWWWPTIGDGVDVDVDVDVAGSRFFFTAASEDFDDPAWKNENPSADNNNIAPTSIRDVNFTIVEEMWIYTSWLDGTQ